MNTDKKKIIMEMNLEVLRPTHNIKFVGMTKPSFKDWVLFIILDWLLPAFCFGVIVSVIWTSIYAMMVKF